MLPDDRWLKDIHGDDGWDSVLVNLTSAEVRLNEKASGSIIISAGPVTGKNGKNTVKTVPLNWSYPKNVSEE